MAELTIVLPNTLEIIPLSDVDFSVVRGKDIIDALIEYRIIPYEKGEYGYPQYELIRYYDGYPRYPIDKLKTLSDVGLKSGDELKLIAEGKTC